MAVSDVDIANRALTKLGEERILDLSDDTKTGRAVNSMYEIVRDRLLRRYRWRFALKRASIAADATAPTWGYSTRYSIPSDCLAVDRVGEFYGTVTLSDYRGADEAPYSIEGGFILTDMGAPLSIRYHERVTDPARFDAAFVECFACLLAVELAETLTQSPQKRELAWGEFKDARRDAISANAIETPPDAIADTDWTLARL